MRRRKYSDEYRHYRQPYSPEISPLEQIARTALELQKLLGVDSFDSKYSDSTSRPDDNSWYNDKYYSLCISKIPHRLSDSDIRDAIYHECKHLGDFNVKLSSYNGQRVAYINFRSSRYAAKAYSSLKNFKLDSKLVHLEPVTQNSLNSRNPRNPRSRSPQLSYNHDNYSQNNRRSNGSYSPVRYNRHRSRSMSRISNKVTMKDHKSNYSVKDTTAIPTRTLFVGNLPCSITENDLKDLFGKFGDVTDVDIKKPTSNRQGNSYAFIKFENLDIANQAKTEMSGYMVGKCQIKIGFGKVNPTNCVWVGGLGPWILYDAFEKEMIRFGVVKQIEWPHNKNYAYVLYESVDIAITAVNKLRGSHFGDETKPIKVDFADANVIKSNFYNAQKSDNDHSNSNTNSHNNNSNSRSSNNKHHHELLKRSNKELSTVIVSPQSKNLSINSDESLSVKSSKSISQLISCLNDVWTGMIVLKNNNFGCRLYMLKGEQSLINEFMLTPASNIDHHHHHRNNIDNLTITQRMKLDIQKLAEMSQRIEFAGENGFCLMLASSYIVDTKLVSDCCSQPQRPLKNLITYLRTKESAGVIFLKSNSSSNSSASGGGGGDSNNRTLSSGVLHAFPPCDFSFDILLQKAPNLTKDFSKDDFLVILLIRNST